MQIVEKDIKEIIPYERNPRKNDKAVDKVAASIEEFGFKVPIVVDKDNIIVAGHTRYKAARKLHLTTVPVIVADDLNENQIKAFRLADNKVSELAEWDDDLLALELEDIIDLDMTDFGFELTFDEEETEAIEDDFEVELPEEPKSKLGQVYQLGNHRLMCGDSTKEEDVLKLMNGNKADLLLTDPPYNVNYEGGTKDKLKIQNDNMEKAQFKQFLFDAFKNAHTAMKPGAVFYVWYASREVVNFQTALEESGLEVRQELIWNKSSLIMGRQDYQWKHEPCLYGWKEGASHLWASDRKQTTVIDMAKPQKSDLHPTMKPIPLFDYQIKNNTKGGDIVLDLFSGSGTTIMACEQNGRVAYGMEYDPRYVDVIIERWEKFTGKKAVLLNE
ncbi:MAG: ParB N-terminal domain-containing protein [Bacteroidales bacterium]|nr:ParB N-terminal domain-containing protein [Candidatus Minthousia equi]